MRSHLWESGQVPSKVAVLLISILGFLTGTFFFFLVRGKKSANTFWTFEGFALINKWMGIKKVNVEWRKGWFPSSPPCMLSIPSCLPSLLSSSSSGVVDRGAADTHGVPGLCSFGKFSEDCYWHPAAALRGIWWLGVLDLWLWSDISSWALQFKYLQGF